MCTPFLKPIDLTTAVQLLNDGSCVAIPTETVYGLAARIDQPQAIKKIFAIKERPFFDPLIVHIANLPQLSAVTKSFSPLAKKIAAKFWPGPLTIVLPKNPVLDSHITSGLDTVGVRMPNHALALKLIESVGVPLAAPSANKFGRTSPTQISHVISEFNGGVPVLDGGPCSLGVESTVIGLDDTDSIIKIYRPGAITAEMLSEFGHVERVESPVSPGHLKHHYMPTKPLVILSTLSSLNEQNYKFICKNLNLNTLLPSYMYLSSEAPIAARALYANMRVAAEKKSYANCILLHYPFSQRLSGLWASISDRLAKSASLVL